MKRLGQLTACVTLAAFLGFSALEAFHTHRALQSEANCTICQMAHQNPVLTNPPAVQQARVTVRPIQITIVPHPYLSFVFETHGLSPPAL